MTGKILVNLYMEDDFESLFCDRKGFSFTKILLVGRFKKEMKALGVERPKKQVQAQSD